MVICLHCYAASSILSRRKKKLLSAFSLAFALTVSLRAVRLVEEPSVEYFLDKTEISDRDRREAAKIIVVTDDVDLVTEVNQIVSEVNLTTKDSSECCKDDFHQNPYVSTEMKFSFKTPSALRHRRKKIGVVRTKFENVTSVPKRHSTKLKTVNYNNSSLDIPLKPNVTTNISFSTFKIKSLAKISKIIDFAKFSNNLSYRNSVVSQDLSQWDDVLVLPEEAPQNTDEPRDYSELRTKAPEGSGPVRPVGSGPVRPVGSGPVRPVGSGPVRPVGSGPVRPVGSGLVRPVGSGLVRPVGKTALKAMGSDLERLIHLPFTLRDIPRYPIRKEFNPATPAASKESFRSREFGRRGKAERGILLPFHLDYTRPAYFPWRSTNDECINYSTRFLVRGTGKIVPLASVPGSGNTWFRYISEALTGVFSGSLYEDDTLATKGFWGERDSYVEGTTLLQKTHSFPVIPKGAMEWDGQMIIGPPPRKVVLMIRNPYDAIVSLRHFHAAGHTGFGHNFVFSGSDWDNFTEIRAGNWLQLNKAWLQLPDSEILVIHYEMLLQNLENESKRYLRFLGIPLNLSRLACLLRYPEGKFRRPRYPKHLQGYHMSNIAKSSLKSAMAAINKLLASKGHPILPTHLYTFYPQMH